MNKPYCLQKGDKVAIISLSSGILGESFIHHELELGIKRLKDFGLEPVFMPNSQKGIEYLEQHPEKRAEDLKTAFLDESIKGIICAIGGNDTYKTIPYLMEDEEFKTSVKNNPKIFTGFSDSTTNHLLLHHLGLETFYGPNFLVDLAELDKDMLPYTKEYFLKFFQNEEKYQIESSDTWYYDRESYGAEQLGIPRKSTKETHGYEVLNGSGVRKGKLYGGCLEIIIDALAGTRHQKAKDIMEKYHILPTLAEWQEKILFIETSDEKPTPDKLEAMLTILKDAKILENVQGLIVGKPQDEIYYEEYKKVYQKIFQDIQTPVLYNVNFGHSVPRCIIPYGARAIIDYDKKTITINEPILLKD